MPRNRKSQADSNSPVFLPRRSTRRRNEEKYGGNRIKKYSPTILDLPNELILMILKMLPQEDLVCSTSVVCRRLNDLTITFWTKIEFDRDMPKEMIYKWICRAPLVKHLVIRNRRDMNEILGKVCQHSKELETIEVCNGSGSHRSSRMRGNLMCDLITNCPKLSFIHFCGTRFNSCKFFKLLPNSEIVYVGMITHRELSAALKSVSLHEMKKPIALGVKSIKGRCRLKLNPVNISRMLAYLEFTNKDRLISIIWNASKELFNCYFNVENLDVLDIL